MTNLDSILKNRDITLARKVHLVKAMVYPVVVCECESWTIKKASELKNKEVKSFCLDILQEDSLKPHKNSEPMSEKAFYFLGHSWLT